MRQAARADRIQPEIDTDPARACTLADLASVPRWVAWQTEPRPASDAAPDATPALTKMPYAPRRQVKASATDPATWGTRADAEARHRGLPRRHGPSGVGLVLGKRADQPHLALGGIDLDTCRDPETGELTDWASIIIARFATYTEISPSGTGAKLFFHYRVQDRPALGDSSLVNGRPWKRGQGTHPPAIELHLNARYFTVTGLRLPDAPEELRVISVADLQWLLRHAGPSFRAGRPIEAAPLPVAETTAAVAPRDAWARVQEAALHDVRLHALTRGDFGTVRDTSGSGIAFALGRAIRAAGFSYEDMSAALCACPLTRGWATTKGMASGGREMRRIWDKASATADSQDVLPTEPRPLFRPIGKTEPYPLQALGPVLGPAAEAVQQLTQAPAAICAQSVLGVAALAVQPFADVQMPTGETRPVSLYLLTIAASGERKSSTDNRAMAGVRERERAMAEGYDEALRTHRNAHDVWKRDRERILGTGRNRPADPRQALDNLGPEPRPPIKPLIVVNEPTWEGLVKMLPEAEPSLGLFSAEGGAFLGGHGMSEDARIRTAAGLSEAWDGTPIKRVRGGDGTAVYHGRRLSAHLLVQPEVAKDLLGDEKIAGAGGQGLVNRFLIAAPESNAGTRLYCEPDPAAEAVLDDFARRITTLLAALKPLAAAQRDVLAPRVLPLSPEACRRWIEFHDDNERELGEGGAFHAIAGFANKAPEHAARIAAVLTLIEVTTAAEIGDAAMTRAIELVKHYRGEALRLVQGADVPPHLLAAEKLRVWLLDVRKQELVSLPDIYQRGPYALRTQAASREAVLVLVRHGWLVPNEAGDVGGKQRREVWRVTQPTRDVD